MKIYYGGELPHSIRPFVLLVDTYPLQNDRLTAELVRYFRVSVWCIWFPRVLCDTFSQNLSH